MDTKLFAWNSLEFLQLLSETVESGLFLEQITLAKGGTTLLTSRGEVLFNLVVQSPISRELSDSPLWFDSRKGFGEVAEFYNALDDNQFDQTASLQVIPKLMYLATIRNVRIGTNLNLYEVHLLRKKYPELKWLMDAPYEESIFPHEFQAQLNDRRKRLYDLLVSTDSIWGDFIRSGTLQIGQISQIFLSIGPRPDDSGLIQMPITESYLSGLNNLLGAHQLGKSNRRTAIFSHVKLRDSGHTENLQNNLMQAFDIDYDMLDCHNPVSSWSLVMLGSKKAVRAAIGLVYLDPHDGTSKLINSKVKPGLYRIKTIASCGHPTANRCCMTCANLQLAKHHREKGLKFGIVAAAIIGVQMYQQQLSMKHHAEEAALVASIVGDVELYKRIFYSESGFIFIRPDAEIPHLTLKIAEKYWEEELIKLKKPVSGDVVVSEIDVYSALEYLGTIKFKNSVLYSDWADISTFQEEMSPRYAIPAGDFLKQNTGPIFEVRGIAAGMEQKISGIRGVVRMNKDVSGKQLINPDEWLSAVLEASEQAGMKDIPLSYWSVMARLLWRDKNNQAVLPKTPEDGVLLKLIQAIKASEPVTAFGIARRFPFNEPDLLNKDIEPVLPLDSNYTHHLLFGYDE